MEKNIAKSKKYAYPITWQKLKAQASVQLVAILGILFFLVFSYIPMLGIVIAFKNYQLAPGIMGIINSEWVGLKYFNEFFNDPMFWPVVKNTLLLSSLKIIISFPIPILLAIILNEVKNQKLKRFSQTVSYLPYFISWVVVSGMLFAFLNVQDGLLNQLLFFVGVIDQPIAFLSEPRYFRTILVLSDVWKNAGWWTILFLASIAGIDPTLHEAATVDGAGRIRRIWHITLPAMKGTTVVVLILCLGNMLGGGLGGSNFEQSYLLGGSNNRMVYDVSVILQTYTLEMGLKAGRFSYAAAIGLLESLFSLILVYTSNYLAKRSSGTGLF
ncbi:ABC transporter permease [Paenibacillus nasutitermitis]|uniref:Sugar ABC transporter permease n=1 Tax=Paenibacillus nasutitermitis TaxID=1652958 RepID=A0A916ZDE4_9BACL|nr:ABC transporter permease subunit [Paenibacillus nasutitermitis]GGD89764.1 sugar ABC transporter permease [Paenibacillus nasutitermitis]